MAIDTITGSTIDDEQFCFECNPKCRTLRLHAYVKIRGLEALPGRIRAITEDAAGTMYKVVYWHECKLQDVWLYADELED